MTGLPDRILGRSGLRVTRLGYGAMELGDAQFGRNAGSKEAETILNRVLDVGINFIDTSIDYGASEERIGRWISHRRSEFHLASKCGCPLEDEVRGEADRGSGPTIRDRLVLGAERSLHMLGLHPFVSRRVVPRFGGRMVRAFGGHVFSRENIVAGVEQSLRRLRTDHLDLLQFHCEPTRRELERGEAIQTLEDLRRQGKIRLIGMSSTLPALDEHIDMGVFDAFQVPYSLLARGHEAVISRAAQAGAGTIIRGGAAQGAPSHAERPRELAWRAQRRAERARDLWRRAGLDDLLDGDSIMEFTLRFTLTHPDVDTVIVGTADLDHLDENVRAFQRGPLAADLYAEAKRRLSAAGSGPF